MRSGWDRDLLFVTGCAKRSTAGEEDYDAYTESNGGGLSAGYRGP
jgi:hypothetical protein